MYDFGENHRRVTSLLRFERFLYKYIVKVSNDNRWTRLIIWKYLQAAEFHLQFCARQITLIHVSLHILCDYVIIYNTLLTGYKLFISQHIKKKKLFSHTYRQ